MSCSDRMDTLSSPSMHAAYLHRYVWKAINLNCYLLVSAIRYQYITYPFLDGSLQVLLGLLLGHALAWH